MPPPTKPFLMDSPSRVHGRLNVTDVRSENSRLAPAPLSRNGSSVSRGGGHPPSGREAPLEIAARHSRDEVVHRVLARGEGARHVASREDAALHALHRRPVLLVREV